MTKIVDILDRETVEEKVRHYKSVVSDYESKYCFSYEMLEKKFLAESTAVTSRIEDDLLDWKEALLMLSIYERMLGELTRRG